MLQIKWKTKLFDNQTIVIKRFSPSVYVDFEFVKVDPQCIPDVKCNIQPFKQEQKRFTLPEGYRVEDCLLLRSRAFMFLTTESHLGKASADEFDLDGVTYEIYRTQNWKRSNLSTSHFSALAVKKDPDRTPKED